MVTSTVELKSLEKVRLGFCTVSLSLVSFAVLTHFTSPVAVLAGPQNRCRSSRTKTKQRREDAMLLKGAVVLARGRHVAIAKIIFNN